MLMMFMAALTLDRVLRITHLLHPHLRLGLHRDPVHRTSLSDLLERLLKLCLLSLPLESADLSRLL